MNKYAQIVAAYERNGMNPEEIAENLGYDVGTIKIILASESSMFRRELKGVSEEETQEMLEIIKDIARNKKDECPGVALKAATYVHSEGRGRNNLRVGGAININIINERLAGMKAAKERAYLGAEKVVDIKD